MLGRMVVRPSPIVSVLLSVTFLCAFLNESTDRGVNAAGPQYVLVENWVQSPLGEKIGGVSSVDVDPDGVLYVFRRTLGDVRTSGSVWTFEPSGKFLREWQKGIAKQAHTIYVDHNRFIWTVDSKGHQVKKFTSDGKLVMSLGQYDLAGNGPSRFNQPTDVVVVQNGDVFITDGYGNQRVVKFNKDGKFLKEWGVKGVGPGQFRVPHAIVQDSRGRLLVGDRCGSTTAGNAGCTDGRIQIFDTEGKFLEEWTHLGLPFGLHISKDDTLYVSDLQNARISLVDARTGKLLETLERVRGGHNISVDPAGNVYVASLGDKGGVLRYTRDRR